MRNYLKSSFLYWCNFFIQNDPIDTAERRMLSPRLDSWGLQVLQDTRGYLCTRNSYISCAFCFVVGALGLFL